MTDVEKARVASPLEFRAGIIASLPPGWTYGVPAHLLAGGSYASMQTRAR